MKIISNYLFQLVEHSHHRSLNKVHRSMVSYLKMGKGFVNEEKILG